MSLPRLTRPPRFAEFAAAGAGDRPLNSRQRRARFREIFGIARRHGLLPFGRLDFSRDPATSAMRRRQAKGLRSALETAGGGFIKAGQLLSTRDDLLPPEWVAELSHLQKSVAPADPDEVAALLAAEWGPRRELLSAFDDEPAAAASIAQVHRGRLADGREVAVKVQRPGIVPLLACDIDIMLRIARWLTLGSAQARQVGIEGVARQYADDLRRQADFASEAANLAALSASARRAADEVLIPDLVPELSTARVLVMEYVEGPTLADLGDDLDAPVDDALRTVLSSFLRQMVIDGAFHADLHPGNIILTGDGRPALIDFGSVGRIDSELRDTVQELAIGFLTGDTRRLGDAALRIMPIDDPDQQRAFRRDLARFVTHELGDGSQVTLQTVDRASDLFLAYGSPLPPDLLAAARAFAILEGTVRTSARQFDILAESRSLANGLIMTQLAPASIGRMLGDTALGMVPRLRRLPNLVDQIVGDLAAGDLSVNVRLLADPRDRRMLTSLVRRATTSAIGGVLAAASLVLLALPPMDGALLPMPVAAAGLGAGAAGLLGWTAVDAVRARRRR
ncbi:AarF/UbiB family protein [Microbacterium sp. Marseille-Q6648]|uniref:ABC1 kinase family protein n=1 Tax=Microbacterium sp. Marseille-Q6648 TaxID=2937991 RepID=UPI00204101A7|nr:AarF/UbiB family protein [Microbacterium sp. Marseille-Q6648]